jgi:hypothetical protein
MYHPNANTSGFRSLYWIISRSQINDWNRFNDKIFGNGYVR